MTTRKIQHEGGSDASSPTEFLIGESTVDAAGRVKYSGRVSILLTATGVVAMIR